MMEVPNPMTRKLELHNTWLVCQNPISSLIQGLLTREKADGLKYYIDWAVQNGLEVIDANVAKFATGSDVQLKRFLFAKSPLTCVIGRRWICTR